MSRPPQHTLVADCRLGPRWPRDEASGLRELDGAGAAGVVRPASTTAACRMRRNQPFTHQRCGRLLPGRLGQRFFLRLRQAGLIDQAGSDFEDDAAVRRGIGFTDIVKRPTARADAIASAEMEAGVRLLGDRLEPVTPRLIIFTLKRPPKRFFRKFQGSGLRQDFTVAGAPSFVMPSPFAALEEVEPQLIELRDFLRSAQST